jgi:SpoVK/Ycf46/Vps4 family AAA+-type ATPase
MASIYAYDIAHVWIHSEGPQIWYCSQNLKRLQTDPNSDLLDVDLLTQPEMAVNAIDKLVMDANNKEIIKGITRIYTYSEEDDSPKTNVSEERVPTMGKFKRFSADFISGKGEGQIILLHGPPGTGKTLTAGNYSTKNNQLSLTKSESVAEYTKRPLLSITAADLGHEPHALEENLLRYFKRATDWDAIVLLDEADVYLEQRSAHDLRRNSIVSGKISPIHYVHH